MSLSTTKKKQNSNFPSSEEALYFVEDVFGRSMIPFVLLGDTAKSIIEDLDRKVETEIEIGVAKTSFTEYGKSTLKMFLPPDTEWGENEINFEHMGTPVKVRILQRNYRFIKNADHRFYRLTHFLIPNPFHKYWPMRFMLK